MPFQTNLNISPYYDDYDETKNYHQILFRPTTAVQARELTQLQNIFQSQIERFGNWAFKNGDIVQGCSISDVPVVPYVFLADTSAEANTIDTREWVNCIAISATSNLRARILYANVGYAGQYPNSNIIYLNYINTGNNGSTIYSNNELIQVYSSNTSGLTLVANVYTLANVAGTNATGNAHGISVSSGVIFINGAFVKVETPTFGIVNTFGTYAGNTLVGFTALEQIITEYQDSSLYDNALGYPNENAPGAHRLKVTPTLTAVDPANLSGNSTFNPIATYNFGSIVFKDSANALHSTIGDAIAIRTYEEAGNFVVNPFAVDTVTKVPGDSIIGTLDANTVLGRVSPGIGYAQGSRIELKNMAYINMRRGVDTAVNPLQQITFSYGNYLLLDEVAGSFNFTAAQTVTLYDTPQKAVSTRKYSSLTPTGNAIGTATVRCFSYNSGVVGLNTTLYALHIFNIQLNSGYNINQIASVYYNGDNKAVGDVYSNGILNSNNKKQLFGFGITGLKNLKDAYNQNYTNYVFRTISTSQSMNTSGNVVVTIPVSATGGVDELPYGSGILNDSDATTFTLVAAANVDSNALSGTIGISSTNTAVTGDTSTTFTSQLFIGDTIKVGSNIRTVTSIANNSLLTVDSSWPSTLSGQTYYKSYIKGKIIPIAQYQQSSPSSYVNVTNTTSFTIVSNQVPSSTLTVDVIYDVKRTQVVPAKKTIYKDRFVKINTTTNPNGPWCLGFSDIHQIKKIYASSDGSYTTSGIDVTSQFVFDSGQKDTHYDLGYLYSAPGYGSTSNPYLLVQLDYFAPNTASGSGFYTVESYPIDDVNTSNTNAIQTKDIPLYIDESGNKLPLRDYIDFRPVANITANNTGVVDFSNTLSVSIAISYANTNPLNTLTFNVPGSQLHVPAYTQNFEANYTYFLPRKDLIYVTSDNVLKVKEGLSSANPQTPLFPENAMAVSVLNVPAYPSLSSDQTNSLLGTNRSSKTLIRDTSLSITSSLVTNRRYTMKDIGTLEQRITNLEYYATLSLLEQNTSSLNITDANGLTRFKNGIFVDPFNDHSLGDVSNPEYNIAIDRTKGVARPSIDRTVVDIEFNVSNLSSVSEVLSPTKTVTYYVDSTNNIQKTGRVLTLPYAETPLMVQPYATKYRNAAHVAFAWNGTLVIVPSYDNHQDTINTGSLNIVIDNSAAWKDFAAGPMGQIYNDWSVATSTTVSTILTQDKVTIDLGYVAGGTTAGAIRANIWTYLARAGYDPSNATIGTLNILWTSDIRLKKQIKFLTNLVEGINLYSFKYLWSDKTYIGLMAQEVEKIIPEAVVKMDNGYLAINYGMLGINMIEAKN